MTFVFCQSNYQVGSSYPIGVTLPLCEENIFDIAVINSSPNNNWAQVSTGGPVFQPNQGRGFFRIMTLGDGPYDVIVRYAKSNGTFKDVVVHIYLNFDSYSPNGPSNLSVQLRNHFQVESTLSINRNCPTPLNNVILTVNRTYANLIQLTNYRIELEESVPGGPGFSTIWNSGNISGSFSTYTLSSQTQNINFVAGRTYRVSVFSTMLCGAIENVSNSTGQITISPCTPDAPTVRFNSSLAIIPNAFPANICKSYSAVPNELVEDLRVTDVVSPNVNGNILETLYEISNMDASGANVIPNTSQSVSRVLAQGPMVPFNLPLAFPRLLQQGYYQLSIKTRNQFGFSNPRTIKLQMQEVDCRPLTADVNINGITAATGPVYIDCASQDVIANNLTTAPFNKGVAQMAIQINRMTDNTCFSRIPNTWQMFLPQNQAIYDLRGLFTQQLSTPGDYEIVFSGINRFGWSAQTYSICVHVTSPDETDFLISEPFGNMIPRGDNCKYATITGRNSGHIEPLPTARFDTWKVDIMEIFPDKFDECPDMGVWIYQGKYITRPWRQQDFYFNNITLDPATGQGYFSQLPQTTQTAKRMFKFILTTINGDCDPIVQEAYFHIDVECPWCLPAPTDPGTGVSSNSGLEKILVAPNPTNGVTLFSFELEKEGNIELQLFDINGKLVKSVVQGQFLGEGSNNLEVDLTELTTGIYLYRLSHPTGSFSGKVVKQ